MTAGPGPTNRRLVVPFASLGAGFSPGVGHVDRLVI